MTHNPAHAPISVKPPQLDNATPAAAAGRGVCHAAGISVSASLAQYDAPKGIASSLKS